MTSSLFRGRPRRAEGHIRARVTHAVLGALVGAGWLMLPLMTIAPSAPVPAASAATAASASAPGAGGTSTADFVLPLVAVAAAAVLAAYGYLRRVRRSRTRTTPGTMPGHPRPPTLADAERQARSALVLADDCVRTSREELSFVRERFGVLKGEAVKDEVGAGEGVAVEEGAGPAAGAGVRGGRKGGAGAGAEAPSGTAAGTFQGARWRAETERETDTGARAAAEARDRPGTTAEPATGAGGFRPASRGAEGNARAQAARDAGTEAVTGALVRAPREAGAEAVTQGFVRALRGAEAELVAAFAMWRRYEEGFPEEAAARRQALAGVVGRCAEAGRRLDAEAAALDQVRGLEGPGAGAAAEVAERRFRALAVRTVVAHGTLTALRERYAASATDLVTGSVEQAKDRLLFATARLNEARQAIDAADGDRAARSLRAGEGAVAQAEVLVSGVERLAARLREAAALVPAALTGAEADLAAARHGRSRTPLASGEQAARLAHADGVLAAVREELTGALPYDPLDALRRITRAVARLDVGRSGVLDAAALLVAHAAVDSADDFVAVHRGAVGPEARARLSEAARTPVTDTGSAFEADTAAREARALAERDVRAHGTPYPDSTTAGLPGAVLGGILLAEDPDGGPPASFGGPATRGRRHMPAP
ncbi:hypothetical protein Shyhy01_44960 [Streptomyces hygroscopicus subsp. hygroscopicus]|nr:hypothetical protein [Streptomyces hygroscopicus]GLX51546.1 hypothetical protein Shyhy01_44960 [Streptomyces hygroscopicus subsp. hygroscopicus]